MSHHQTPLPLQDDHCWIVVAGETWAIRRWRPPILYLWRGYHPHLQYSVFDTSGVDWEVYANNAVELLEAYQRGEL